MKRTFPLIAAALLLATAAAGAQPGSFRHDRDERRGHRAERLTQELGLSESQQAAAKQLHEQLRETMKPLHEEQRALHEQVETALEQGADAATVGNLVITAHQKRQAMRAAREELERDFAALLTPEQLAKYETLKEKRESFGGKRRGGRHD
ncbi:MAG TPA: Spy/CpxP family protein refolding chaperone [Thermoanaerobaculia bacterium]|nr:Spy/CpxP family protein refolding chaperone [Thermoanaerobaculia bacterium]